MIVALLLTSLTGCASNSYIGMKFYPPHNEWTPQPGASAVGVDRWAIELMLNKDIIAYRGYNIFAGVNPEFHFMIDWPDDIDSDYSGDLRDVTVRYHCGIRKNNFELRYFHGYERWYPDSRAYSRWLYSGVELRYYFWKDGT